MFFASFLNLSVNYFNFDFAKITLFALIFVRLIPLGQRMNALINTIVSFASLYVAKILYESEKNKALVVGDNFNYKKTIIEFKNVSFSYDNSNNNKILKNIDLSIPEKKITAIVGRSGAGKSTLIDLLARIIVPDSGSIYIDKNKMKIIL